MNQKKPLHIVFIARLEKEKGVEIVLAAISRSRVERGNIIWHIFGYGSYIHEFEKLEKYDNSDIHVYGYAEQSKIQKILSESDITIMPSLMLETFGLVALESLSCGVPVIGFAHSGLREFIHPDLILDGNDPIGSLFRIIEIGRFPLIDITRYSYVSWKTRLSKLLEGKQRILLVNDYTHIVGGAEKYLLDLRDEIIQIGKQAEMYGYDGSPSRGTRIVFMFLAPFAWWRSFSIKKKIGEYNPDIIWMHSVMRYIGPHVIGSITQSGLPCYITHHDLGLISPRPSQIVSESDIPDNDLGSWIPKGANLLTLVLVFLKWSYIQWIWRLLGKSDKLTHILPTEWMKPFFQKYTQQDIVVFPHSLKK